MFLNTEAGIIRPLQEKEPLSGLGKLKVTCRYWINEAIEIGNKPSL